MASLDQAYCSLHNCADQQPGLVPPPGTALVLNSVILSYAGQALSLQCNFPSLQNISTHSANVYLDHATLIGTITTGLSEIQSGIGFPLHTGAIPAGTRPGRHTITVMILPEHVSADLDIFVCDQNGKGCDPLLGFFFPHSPYVNLFFDTVQLPIPFFTGITADGFQIPKATSISPVGTAELWVDRVCVNTPRRCRETGTQLGTANVFPDGINVPVGGVGFGLW